jgi:hypothetical protein
MLAAIISIVELRRIVKSAGFLVPEKRVVLPAVPQGLDDIDVFLGSAVPIGMSWLHIQIEIAGSFVAG